MVFSSEIFIFTFLPAFLLAYYALPFRWRSTLIVGVSYLFYGWWRADFLLLLFSMTVWVYGFGTAINAAEQEGRRKALCAIGVAGCLVVLGFFKYFNFFVDSFAELVGRQPQDLGFTFRVILPIGISFFVFHAISYLVDVTRKEVPPARNFIDFAAFISLFPHLVAGPVLRYKDLSAQLRQREHSLELFGEGLRWFVLGLAKKVLVADSISPIADTLFAIPHPTFTESWLGAIAYASQLYFDFSGYSEMAVGLGLMIGIRFIQNFKTPYASRSITEFWQRWHISLSVWLRDYLYIPLGGNRKGAVRNYLNLFATMLIGGLWHGANWTFVLWGAYHGVLLAAERAFGIKAREASRSALYIIPTLLLVVIGWVVFRAPDLHAAADIYWGMMGGNGLAMRPAVGLQMGSENLAVLAVSLAIIAVEPRFSSLKIPSVSELMWQGRPGWSVAAVGLLAVACVLRISEQSSSPFLYFQF